MKIMRWLTKIQNTQTNKKWMKQWQKLQKSKKLRTLIHASSTSPREGFILFLVILFVLQKDILRLFWYRTMLLYEAELTYTFLCLSVHSVRLSQRMSEYSSLLSDLSENITNEDVEQLKSACKEDIPEEQSNSIISSKEWFSYLEKNDKLAQGEAESKRHWPLQFQSTEWMK